MIVIADLAGVCRGERFEQVIDALFGGVDLDLVKGDEVMSEFSYMSSSSPVKHEKVEQGEEQPADRAGSSQTLLECDALFGGRKGSCGFGGWQGGAAGDEAQVFRRLITSAIFTAHVHGSPSVHSPT